MICDAIPEQIEYVCEHMRESDRREIATLYNPENAFLMFLRVHCYCFAMDKPVCLFGFTEKPEGREAWVIATEEIKKYSVTFLRGSKHIFSCEENFFAHVHRENKLSARWLKWLGMVQDSSITINGEIFDKWVMKCR